MSKFCMLTFTFVCLTLLQLRLMRLIRPLTVHANVPWKVLENIEKNWQNSSHIQQMNFFCLPWRVVYTYVSPLILKAFVAIAALVWPIPMVWSVLHYQIWLKWKTFVTMSTFVWFLTTVNFKMSSQRFWLTRSFVTMSRFVRFLTTVNFVVSLQRSWPTLNFEVSSQRSWLTELFVTVSIFVRFLPTVNFEKSKLHTYLVLRSE